MLCINNYMPSNIVSVRSTCIALLFIILRQYQQRSKHLDGRSVESVQRIHRIFICRQTVTLQ